MRQSRRSRLFFFGGVAVLLALSRPRRALAVPDYKVVLSSAVVQPGDTLRVELDGVSTRTFYKALFQGKSYSFYAVGPSAERALIGIPLGLPPGVSTLVIRPLGAPKATADDRYAITVASRTYITEDIRFTSQKNSLSRWEHQESARIHKTALTASHHQNWEGTFNPPVTGSIIAEFGLHRTHNGGAEAGYHKGIDFRAAQGTPVLASNGGVVLIAYPFKAHGKTVLLDHGQGVMTIYLHMSALAVRPGEHVTKGQIIGKVGQTGLATAPHVHWQVFVHSVAVDPHPWMSNEF